MVLNNDATYQHNDQEVEVTGENLMRWCQPINIANLALECYPNRNSINYKEIYGIERVKDILRGTLRYEGFCHIMQAIKSLGLMQTKINPAPNNITWKDYVLGLNKADNIEQLKTKISTKSWDALSWLGCFSEQVIASNKDNSLDVLCELLLQKLAYQAHEKDMVILQHKFVIKKADGHRQYLTSTLKQIGVANGGYSAMAKTVAYPAAMAAEMIVDNKIKASGLLLPISKDIYQPILKNLQTVGITFTEKILDDSQTSTEEFLSELHF
jgi:saccharopine dehydrogenase-like NADP-dependent oxidoreductase